MRAYGLRCFLRQLRAQCGGKGGATRSRAVVAKPLPGGSGGPQASPGIWPTKLCGFSLLACGRFFLGGRRGASPPSSSRNVQIAAFGIVLAQPCPNISLQHGCRRGAGNSAVPIPRRPVNSDRCCHRPFPGRLAPQFPRPAALQSKIHEKFFNPSGIEYWNQCKAFVVRGFDEVNGAIDRR